MDTYTHTKKIEFDINTNINNILIRIGLIEYYNLDSTQGRIECESIYIVNNSDSPLTLTNTIYCTLYLGYKTTQGRYTDLSEDNPLIINGNVKHIIDYTNSIYNYSKSDITFDDTGNCKIHFRIILNTSDLIEVDYTSNLFLTNSPDLYGATEITEEDKQALYDGYAAIKTKILIKDQYNANVETIITEEDSIKSWNLTDERYVPENGFIGQFVAKTLDGELHNITDNFNIENREIILLMGIVKLGSRYTYLTSEDGTSYIRTEDGRLILVSELDEDETTWYQLGTYIVTKPEDDEVLDSTTFDSMDYTVKFNVDFNADYINDTFTTSFNDTIKSEGSFTALELAQYVCSQVGVEFGSTSFTNSDFIIDSNQFTEGNSCRDVMKSISQLAYGWVRIGWDDKCYIDEPEMDTNNISNYNTIDNDHYYSLNTQKLIYGPINRVVIGMSSVVGNESIAEDKESIKENGLTELDIFDNPITYTEALREQAKEGANNLIGLSYIPHEMETPGHPWLKGNELIKIVDMEDNVKYSYAFNRTIKYTGHIKTDITAPSQTETEVATAYQRTIYKTLREVGIKVDKQEGLISSINSRVEANKEGLGKLETRVETEITDTYSKQEIKEIISGTNPDGTVVSSVKSASGTFDMNGLTIEQSEASTKTNINANGMIIYNKTSSVDDPLLTVNSNGVIAKNVKVETYLNIGKHSRIEDYTHTDYTEGTGVFWIGSDY